MASTGKFDLHTEALPLDQAQAHNGKCFSFGDYPKSVAVRGVYKMVDRFIRCFLTPIGTHPSDVDYGTTLASSFLGNVDSTTLFALTSESVNAAVAKMRAYDSEYGFPDDERIATVQIDNIVLDPTGPGAVIYLSIVNVEGTRVSIALPDLISGGLSG